MVSRVTKLRELVDVPAECTHAIVPFLVVRAPTVNLGLVKLLGPIRRLTLTIVRARVNSVIALGSGVHGRRFGRGWGGIGGSRV